MNAKRQLHETYNYLMDRRGAVALNSYVSVGKNTLPNMIPYLTGKGLTGKGLNILTRNDPL